MNSDNLLIFKFRNANLKDNLVNNLKKLECSQISKFLPFKMIRSTLFEKTHLGGQILYRSPDHIKNGLKINFNQFSKTAMTISSRTAGEHIIVIIRYEYY